MNPLKKLAGQTAIYGLGSILGRLLNYLLVPLHTGAFEPDKFGIITELYAYVAFLIVLLTYGLETTFFRFVNQSGHDRKNIYATAIHSLLTTTGVFVAIGFLFRQDVAELLNYADHSEYVLWFALIIGLDAVVTMPMAQLRLENRPKKFVLINLSSVSLNILLNLFWVGYCMDPDRTESNWLIDTFYNESIGVGYVFLANLAASALKFALLIPEFLRARKGAQFQLLRPMLSFGLPLMFAGLAGIANETLDRILLMKILTAREGLEEARTQVGIYGACYKLSIIISLFVQAFRYAAEPFFFAQEKEKGSKQVYATIMNYFVIVVSGMFLVVTMYIDIFKYFISNEAYWVGLPVVPILLLANIFLGVYFNQTFWYKLSKNTHFGALLTFQGAIITVALNFLLIPTMGYMGSAWATLACYSSMVVSSYFLGQKHYPIPYNLPKIGLYLGVAIGFYFLANLIRTGGFWSDLGIGTLLLGAFAALVLVVERPNLKKLL